MVTFLVLALSLSAGKVEPVVPSPVLGVVLHQAVYRTKYEDFAHAETYEDFVLFPLAIGQKKSAAPFFPPEWEKGARTSAELETRLHDQSALVAGRRFFQVGNKRRAFVPHKLVVCPGSMGTAVFGYQGSWESGDGPSDRAVVCSDAIPSLLAKAKADAYPTKDILTHATSLITEKEPAFKGTYTEWLGFDLAHEGTPRIDSIQAISLPHGQKAVWINVTQAYQKKDAHGRSFDVLYTSLYEQHEHVWSLTWEQTGLLNGGNPIYEPQYILLDACDTNRDGVAEFIFQRFDMEDALLFIYELRDGKLVEIANIYGVA